MQHSLLLAEAGRERISDRELTDGLEKILNDRYGRILQTAAEEWERRFAGREPSDACVSVRISAWDRTLSGASATHDQGLPPLGRLIG